MVRKTSGSKSKWTGLNVLRKTTAAYLNTTRFVLNLTSSRKVGFMLSKHLQQTCLHNRALRKISRGKRGVILRFDIIIQKNILSAILENLSKLCMLVL